MLAFFKLTFAHSKIDHRGLFACYQCPMLLKYHLIYDIIVLSYLKKWYSFLVSTKDKMTKPLRWEKHFLSVLSTILFAIWWNQEWSVLLAKTTFFSISHMTESFQVRLYILSLFVFVQKPKSFPKMMTSLVQVVLFFSSKAQTSSLWGCDVDDCDRYFQNRQTSVILSLLLILSICPSVSLSPSL